jgi:hypothetical protein
MKIADISHEHKIFNLLLTALLLLAILAPLTVTIPGVARSYGPISWKPPVCSIRQRTGHDCPSCGLTRSIVTLYRGEWALSRAYHPAGYLVVLFIFAELILRLAVTRIRLPWIAWGDIGQLFVGCTALGVAILIRA